MSKVADEQWLFDDGDAAKEEHPTLVVNEAFATRFEQKNRDMRIARLEAEVEALDQSIESEDEEEDEVGELVTGEVATEFLEVYARIREHDPALYDNATQFFKEEGQVAPEVLQAKALAKAAKPEKRNPLLEAAIIRGEDEEDEDLEAVRGAAEQLSYVEQQEALKREFKEALAQADAEDDLLEEKKRSHDEQARFEEEYKRFLDKKKREKLSKADDKLRSFWEQDSSGKLSEQEQFLKKFILENGWVDEDAPRRAVTQEEMDALSESEELLDKADEFEAKINFRHEEAADPHEQVVSHPRNMASVRALKPSSRQMQRIRSKESKKAERERLAEELKRLKAEKRRQLLEQLQKRGMAGEEEGNLEARMAGMDEDELEAFMDDYLKLDFQGVIGDVKTRFKYTQVKPDAFGLEEQDILELPEPVLEKYVPMHALAPYRQEPEWKPTQSKKRELRAEKQRIDKVEAEMNEEERELEERREQRRAEKREKKRRKKKQKLKEEEEQALKKMAAAGDKKKKKKTKKSKS